ISFFLTQLTTRLSTLETKIDSYQSRLTTIEGTVSYRGPIISSDHEAVAKMATDLAVRDETIKQVVSILRDLKTAQDVMASQQVTTRSALDRIESQLQQMQPGTSKK